jgi:hypothetical protein
LLSITGSGLQVHDSRTGLIVLGRGHDHWISGEYGISRIAGDRGVNEALNGDAGQPDACISHGARSELGSRAHALLASVIETCRRRGAVVLDFLGTVIAATQQGSATARVTGTSSRHPVGV